MSEENIKFWSCYPDAETLSNETIEEAVDEWISDYWTEDIPETLEIFGYARMKPGYASRRIAEDLQEQLDEEYGDPNGNFIHELTEKQLAAAERFVKEFLGEYECWMCEQVKTITVKVADYREES